MSGPRFAGAVVGVLGFLAASGGPLPAETPGTVPPRLAILPIKLLDTSGEPQDQGADHFRRLTAMRERLAAGLSESGLYRTVDLPPEELRRRCPGEEPDCLLAAAREREAGLVFIGLVHKSSTLILQMWARVVDARTGRDVFSRDLDFRGDTDEAWRRAETFLIGQIRSAAPPAAP